MEIILLGKIEKDILFDYKLGRPNVLYVWIEEDGNWGICLKFFSYSKIKQHIWKQEYRFSKMLGYFKLIGENFLDSNETIENQDLINIIIDKCDIEI